MEFGNTYIFLFGFKIFEPTVILTNLVIFLVSAYYFRQLRVLQNKYAQQTGLFVLLMGLSTCFASVDHGTQYQLGKTFFRVDLFISHSLNLVALYYCFRAAFSLTSLNERLQKNIIYITSAITLLLMLFILIIPSFLIIKVSAGVVLIYSLVIHLINYRKKVPGTGLFAVGIIVSFFSIIVHSLRIAVSDWFNHKDIAHVIIAVSLVIMCTGVKVYSNKGISNSSS